jgi:hypothetical protein
MTLIKFDRYFWVTLFALIGFLFVAVKAGEAFQALIPRLLPELTPTNVIVTVAVLSVPPLGLAVFAFAGMLREPEP